MSTCIAAERVAHPILTMPFAPVVRPRDGYAALEDLAHNERDDGGQYQVALVPMNASKARQAGADSASPTPHLLLLSITWEDLLRQLRAGTASLDPRPSSEIEQFGNVQVNFARHETLRDDTYVELTALEFKLLRFFLSNPYRVISRIEFLETVWGYNCYPTTRTVDNSVLRLRQKLEVDPANPVHFQTVHGVGYKFVP
jgi:DNA-binding response OmpR family regulator